MNPRDGLRGVLFDLDGTLLDTAPDMAGALNQLLAEEGMAAMPFEHIRPHVSHGALRLVRLAFGDPDAARLEDLHRRFLDFYHASIATHTRMFHGFELVLYTLEAAGLRWGIVTNKPAWLTMPLLEVLGLAARSGCVVSGDTLPERKPHPMQLLHAAGLLGLEPVQCVYLGDAERDVQAARNAGMIPLVAGFGYLGAGENPSSWLPDAIIGQPTDLLEWLGLRA
ncbi:MAG: phosphoglycolate phosphatase [Steroidobacteraceae bacterium]